MKSKFVALFLVAAMVCFIAVGCAPKATQSEGGEGGETVVEESTPAEEGGEEDAAYEPCTLTIITHFTNYVDNLFAEYTETFEALYPGIELEWQAYTDYDTDLRVMMNAGDYGDVLSNVDGVEVADFPTFYVPLGTVEELSAKYMFPHEYELDGICYGLPMMVNAMGIVYNKAVFEAAGVEGVPATPDEFLAALKKIKDNTDCPNPFYTNYAAEWTMSQWNDYRTCVAGDPEYINNILPYIDDPFGEGRPDYVIYKLMYDIVANGLCEADPYTTDWEGSKGMMNRGEIGAMALGSWAIVQMQEAGDNPDDIGYMPFPYTQPDGRVIAKAGGDRRLCISAQSEYPEEARMYIDWFLNESGFAQSQMAISPVVGDDFPSVLDSFAEMGVEYINDSPAEESGILDAVDQASVNYWAKDFKWRVIDAAMGNTNETLDEIFADLNAQWAAARDELGVADKEY